jgi:hypothetical protein
MKTENYTFEGSMCWRNMGKGIKKFTEENKTQLTRIFGTQKRHY